LIEDSELHELARYVLLIHASVRKIVRKWRTNVNTHEHLLTDSTRHAMLER
jgi:hypothetical protein